MKRIKYFLLLPFMIFFANCNDFLEEQSQDEVRPSTIVELQQLLNNEGYPSEKDMLYAYIDLLTDDTECFGPQDVDDDHYTDILSRFKDFFTWSNDMFKSISETRLYNSWEILYKKILGCNIVLAYIDKVGGNQRDKLNVRGQALGLRAYYYLALVNLYGQPYNSNVEKPENSLGVPLMLSIDFSMAFPERNTVKEVYDQIEKDLSEAANCLKESATRNKYYQMSLAGVWTLSSRVYLYEENWDKAIAYCDSVLSIKSTLTKLTTGASEYVFNPNSEELIWHFAGYYLGTFYTGVSYKAEKGFYQVSDNLLDSYTPTAEGLVDLRVNQYFEKYRNSSFKQVPLYGSKSNIKSDHYVSYTSDGIRLAEVYLNRAESCIRKFIKNGGDAYRVKALADLNYLRLCRYDTEMGDYLPVEYTDGGQLLDFCKQERRRELCFEGLHRWCDLRRWGMHAFSHTYRPKNGVSITETLKEGDLRYVLLIPQVVMDQNYNLRQNPR